MRGWQKEQRAGHTHKPTTDTKGTLIVPEFIPRDTRREPGVITQLANYHLIKREELFIKPTYGTTTTRGSQTPWERASESSTKEPQARQRAIKREQRRRLSKAGVAVSRDVERSVRVKELSIKHSSQLEPSVISYSNLIVYPLSYHTANTGGRTKLWKQQYNDRYNRKHKLRESQGSYSQWATSRSPISNEPSEYMRTRQDRWNYQRAWHPKSSRKQGLGPKETRTSYYGGRSGTR